MFVTCLEKDEFETTDLDEVLTFFPQLNGNTQLKVRYRIKEEPDKAEKVMNAIVYLVE